MFVYLVVTDTDYSKEVFPSGACILDYLRCSVTFKTPKDLLDAVDYAIDAITSDKIESISKIIRIKNGFENILNWNSDKLSDYNYVDLKMNVVFNSKNKNECQIVEIQFLLNFLLKAKKIGHKYYGIKRKDVEVHSVSNMLYNTNNNYDKYKTKILGMIQDKDINQLSKHFFLRPNCILSMLEYCEYYTVPYFASISRKDHKASKIHSLFLDCLFHFGEILLNEKKPLSCNIGCYDEFRKNKIDDIVSNHKLFIQKYLNFGLGDRPCITRSMFVK